MASKVPDKKYTYILTEDALYVMSILSYSFQDFVLMNKQNRDRTTHRDNKLTVTKGRDLGGWVTKGKGLRSTNW